MSKPEIGQVPGPNEPRVRFDERLKEILEIITGRRGTKLKELADSQERWQDLLADLSAGRAVGANAPTWATNTGYFSGYTFHQNTMNEIWFNGHIPHDYKPGTKIYPHVHWSIEGVNTGTVRWGLEYSIAKGHSQGGFTPIQTVYMVQAYPGKTGGNPTHVITETDEASALVFDFEPDTLVLCRLFRDAAVDTQTEKAWAFFADFHYQSDENLTTTRFPVLGKWVKNVQGHASDTIAKINEIIRLLQ